MKLLFLITCIVIILGVLFGVFIINSNSVLILDDMSNRISKYNLTAPISCKNPVDNILTIQTSEDPSTKSNMYIAGKLMVIIYYKCKKHFAPVITDELQFKQVQKFQKLCEDYIYKNNYESIYRPQDKEDINAGEHRNMSVNLRINNDVTTIHIKIIRCPNETLTFRLFQSYSFTDFTDFDDYIFSIRSMNASPFNILISRIFKTTVANITFSVNMVSPKPPKHPYAVNECSFNISLCQLDDRYCQDETNGFSCKKGYVNIANCILASKNHPHWKCPVESEKESMAFKADFLKKYEKKAKTKAELQEVLTIMENLTPRKSNISLKLSPQDKGSLAQFGLNKFVTEYPDFVKNKASEVTSTYIYKSITTKATNDTKIEIFGNSTDEESIELDLERPKMDESETIKANLFLFNQLDMMDEEELMKKAFDKVDELKDNPISPPDYSDNEDEVLYKNSKFFSLTASSEKAVRAVAFKLHQHINTAQVSWLYEVAHACGYVDKSKKGWKWNTTDCETIISSNSPKCQCSHLSNFAMLMSIKKINKVHFVFLKWLSLIGGIINAVSLLLLIAFLLILCRQKIRIDHLNIAICMLLGTILFLSGYLFADNKTRCSTAAVITQFLFMSAFMWKLILGINVYRILKSKGSCLVDSSVKGLVTVYSMAYGVPFCIVTTFAFLYWEHYRAVAENVCWIDASSNAFLSFLIPVCTIIGVNTIGLVYIANRLLWNYSYNNKTTKIVSNELILFVQLLVSMGFTWIPAYFAITHLWGMYLFVFFFPMQGLLMFLLVVFANEENRIKLSNIIFSRYSTGVHRNAQVKVDSRVKETESKKISEDDNKIILGTSKTVGTTNWSKDLDSSF